MISVQRHDAWRCFLGRREIPRVEGLAKFPRIWGRLGSHGQRLGNIWLSVGSFEFELVVHDAASGRLVVRYMHVAWAQNICVEVQLHNILPTRNARC